MNRRRFLSAFSTLPIVGRLAQQSRLNVARQGSQPYAIERDDCVYLGNEALELVFRTQDGGLEQFTSRTREHDFLSDPHVKGYSWSLRFYNQDYDNLLTNSRVAGSPDITTDASDDHAKVVFQWSSPRLLAPGRTPPSSPFRADIELICSIADSDPESDWQIRIENRDELAISQVICPHIWGIDSLRDDGSDAVYIPTHFGRRTPNPTGSDELPVNRYPTSLGTMQFIAYLADGFGLLAMAKDPGGYRKELAFTPVADTEDSMGLRARHLVPYRPGESVEVPYPITLGLHEGGWQEACDRYREWVETEGWLADADPMVPDRLAERGATYLVLSYLRPESQRERPDLSFRETRKRVAAMQDRLAFPLGFKWQGWETHGSWGSGDFWPPYEGREAFREVITELGERDVQVQPFWNPTFTARYSDYWEQLGAAERDALPRTEQDGSFVTTVDPNQQLEYLLVDMTYHPWRQKMSRVIDKLVEAGIDHIMLDGFPMKWHPCWNDAHDHPLGMGGNWYHQRMRSYLRELHERVDVRDGLILSGEGIADYYLPYMNEAWFRDGNAEAMGTLPGENTEPVPMFQYTFGEYVISSSGKGNIWNGPEWRNAQRVIAARALAWGSNPSFIGPYSPSEDSSSHDEEIVEFYDRIGTARTGYAHRFLVDGEMLERPRLERKPVQIDAPDVSFEEDDVLGRGWRATEDVGIVITYIGSTQSRSLDIELRDQPFSVPESPLVYTVRNGEYKVRKSTRVTLEMEPTDVVLVGVLSSSQAAMSALEAIEAAQNDGLESEILQEIHRTFDDRKYREAREIAEEAPKTTISGQASGFGVVQAIVSAVGTAYLLKRRMHTDIDREKY